MEELLPIDEGADLTIPEAKYEYLDHTADVQLHSWGETLKEAFENVNNKFFILLSDKCLPLFNLNIIYDKINKLNTNLIHIVENNDENKLDYFYNNLIDKTYFNKKDFKKQSQWMVLDRETVFFLIP